MSPASLGLMVLVNLAWALNVVVTKLAVGPLGAPPLFYAGARSMIVVAALAPWLRPVPRELWKILLIGLAISGGSFALLFMGLTTASPSAAGVVSLSGAPMTVLFAILFLGERVRWRRAAGIGLTFGGVALAMSAEATLEANTGVLLVFASAVVGALGGVFVKRLEIGSLRLQAWASVASMVVLVPLSLLVGPSPMPALSRAPWELTACLAFAALIVSVGAHGIYFHLLQRHDANVIVPLTLLNPLLTIALGAWLTDDAVGPRLLIGGALAVAGVAVIVVRPSETFTKRLLVRARL